MRMWIKVFEREHKAFLSKYWPSGTIPYVSPTGFAEIVQGNDYQFEPYTDTVDSMSNLKGYWYMNKCVVTCKPLDIKTNWPDGYRVKISAFFWPDSARDTLRLLDDAALEMPKQKDYEVEYVGRWYKWIAYRFINISPGYVSDLD